MKVLHVVTGLETGGAEIALCRLLERLSGTHDHLVVALRAEGSLSNRVRDTGAKLTHLEMRAGIPSLGALRRLRAEIAHFHPDLIHGWMYHANVAAVLGAVGVSRVPLIWAIRHTLYQLANEPRMTRVVVRASRYLSARATRIVYNAHLSARQHEALGYPGSKTRVIPNGFDLDHFRPDASARSRMRALLGIDKDSFVIGHVARFHPMKNHELLLRAAARYLSSGQPAVFVLVGEGTDKNNKTLANLAERLGISAQVRLCGRHDDTASLSAAFDVACSSSSWGEAFPNVIAEAMACGVPCVATDIGDVREIIGECGRIVRPNDERALAEAWIEIARMGYEARQVLGSRGRERIAGRYSLAAYASAHEGLYRDVLENESCAA